MTEPSWNDIQTNPIFATARRAVAKHVIDLRIAHEEGGEALRSVHAQMGKDDQAHLQFMSASGEYAEILIIGKNYQVSKRSFLNPATIDVVDLSSLTFPVDPFDDPEA